MSARKSRRVPAELKSVQDERLTCRHIQTLMKLQQCTDENEQLKLKIKVLQDETSSCQELHRIARGSQLKIQQLEENFAKEVEKKIKALNDGNQRKLDRILEEKQNIQKQSTERIKELETAMQSLEIEIKEKNEKLLGLADKQSVCEALQEKLRSSSSQLETAEEKSKTLTRELSESKTSNEKMQTEKASYLKKIELLESKLAKMAEKLESEIETKRKLMEQNDFVREIHKLRESVSDLETELKDKERKVDEFKEYINECELKISSLEKSKSLLELERDALFQSSTDLTREVEYLKKKESRPTDSNFSEYVNMKRQLALVKEDNVRLKSVASRTELKTLKADGKKTGRVMSSKRIQKQNSDVR